MTVKPTSRVAYKKPSRINGVSIAFFLVFATGIYVLYCLWPVLAIRNAVKGELADALPIYWRANLRSGEVTRGETIRLKKALTDKIRTLGVTDKKLEVILEKKGKVVAIEARFTLTAQMKGLNKRFPLAFAPRAETDAERVEW